jgi:hydroxymethylpyrimidine/phosphomethylpyrimidine kinase
LALAASEFSLRPARDPLTYSSSKPSTALTIAGFDPSSGAGITADLQVFAAHGLFGTSAITALTVQSTLGVAAVHAADAATLRHTLDHLTTDLPPAGIKIGMLANGTIVETVASFLQFLISDQPKNLGLPIVLDPVILSSSGAALLDPVGLRCLHETLLKHVNWITPNWQELALLAEKPVSNLAEVEAALNLLGERYPHLSIVATAGDRETPVELLRTASGEFHQFAGLHVETTSTHGTGCAFSSALLSRLILGDAPTAAVSAAKSYVEGALRNAPGIGHGKGPMDLLWPLRHAG